MLDCVCLHATALTFSWFFPLAVFSSSSRLLHDGQLLPACSGAEGSAFAADVKWKRHTLCAVQLLPVQQRRPQPGGAAGLRAGQWWAAWHSGVERLWLARTTVASGGTGSQHFLAKWVPGEQHDKLGSISGWLQYRMFVRLMLNAEYFDVFKVPVKLKESLFWC